MLSLAKGEHATALHNYQEESTEESAAAPSNGEEAPPRRRRPAEVRE
jgi:hypothetical protein